MSLFYAMSREWATMDMNTLAILSLISVVGAMTFMTQKATKRLQKNAERLHKSSLAEVEKLLEQWADAERQSQKDTEARIQQALQERALHLAQKEAEVVLALQEELDQLSAERSQWQEKHQALTKAQQDLYEKLCPPIYNRLTNRAWISETAVKEYQDFAENFKEPNLHLNELATKISAVQRKLFVAEEIAAYTARVASV